MYWGLRRGAGKKNEEGTETLVGTGGSLATEDEAIWLHHVLSRVYAALSYGSISAMVGQLQRVVIKGGVTISATAIVALFYFVYLAIMPLLPAVSAMNKRLI